MRRMLLLAMLLVLSPMLAVGYPLDGAATTGIDRLEAYSRAREALLANGAIVPGSLRTLAEVDLRLLGRPEMELPTPDAEFTAAIRGFLGEDAGGYGIAVLDLSDPERPRYAEIAAGRPQNPGSVGKIVVGLGWFQALADRLPDVEVRKRLLVETEITADAFVRTDGHLVPWWRPGDPRVTNRPLAEGDRANLYTFFDWMLSASSNAAASVMMSELMLLRRPGEAYPVSAEAKAAYFDETPKPRLGSELRDALQEPLRRNGLDPQKLRQGKFFTREGKRRVDGPSSVATPRELVRFALRMEQGRLVDEWSSRELKRLLYLTDRRIRYASSPTLAETAVYYKSGSLYGCQPEPGFECGKYRGNRVNYLNSLAIVEADANGQRLHYVVALLSNVLRKNSAEAHRDLAGRIHRLIESMHPAGAGSAPSPPVLLPDP